MGSQKRPGKVRRDQGEWKITQRIPGKFREDQGIPRKASIEQEVRKDQRKPRGVQGKLEEPKR